jgi:Tol biopolymer transport system component
MGLLCGIVAFPRFRIVAYATRTEDGSDGKRLAYTYSDVTSQFWTIPVKGDSRSRPLYRGAAFRSIHPSFSPDGSRIAYIARRFGTKADLW